MKTSSGGVSSQRAMQAERGSGSRSSTSILKGRRVVGLPDKDAPGRKHDQQIAAGLQGIAAEIKVVELPGEGKDVSDWLDAGGTVGGVAPARRGGSDEQVVDQDQDSGSAMETISVKVLPEPIRTFVRRGSAALGVDPSYLATALLATLAGTIGNNRVILLKRGWTEPSVLWCVLVGDSGTLKSPAIDAATKHVRQRQAEAIEVYRKAMETYETDYEQYKADLAAWRHGGKKAGKPPPEEIVKPTCERFTCSDVTVEGLAVLLERRQEACY